jgi:hypothetical protein
MLVMVFKCLCDCDSGVKHLFAFVILDTLNYTVFFFFFGGGGGGGGRSPHVLDT